MKIIISPAKKMVSDTDSLPWTDFPCFLEQTGKILSAMRCLSAEELQRVWKCNDSLAALNMERLQKMDLHKNLTPAILCYEGIQYRYMAPGVFDKEQLDYVQEHLRILSGFYGLLRPFDGVTPYRLEMQAKLMVDGTADLYAFWSDQLAQALVAQDDCVVNLASKEYSVCISRYLPSSVRFVSCIFGEEKNGKIIEKATMCKMARGEMVRYMAENKVSAPEGMKGFQRLQFHFAPEYSEENTYVFLRGHNRIP